MCDILQAATSLFESQASKQKQKRTSSKKYLIQAQNQNQNLASIRFGLRQKSGKKSQDENIQSLHS